MTDKIHTSEYPKAHAFVTTAALIPHPVGHWVLYAGALITTRFAVYAKPTDEQIKNTEALLGWKWEDAGKP